MPRPTPHGQVPDTLIDLIDAYAETRHRCGIYNGKTEAARKAVIEALSEVQALSAAPADQQAVQVIINFPQVGTAGPFPVVDGRVSLPDSTMQDLVRMLRPTYEAEQQAQPDECFPGEPNRKPDCYSIRQITDDEGVVAWEVKVCAPDVAREEANDMMATGLGEICEVAPLWTTPQPSLTAQVADSVQEDAARLDWLEQNLFHREKDEWDTKYGGYKEYNMWVLFSPKGIQGSARNIIDAAREQGADHDR